MEKGKVTETGNGKIEYDTFQTYLVELDDNSQELAAVFLILNDPINRAHIMGAPESESELTTFINVPQNHVFALKIGEEVAGTFTIMDDESGHANSHQVGKGAIRPDLQDKGLGQKMLRLGVDWAFSTKTFDNRDRKILYLWIVENIDGWEKSKAVAEKCGFRQVMREEDFIVIDGQELPMARYHLRYDQPA